MDREILGRWIHESARKAVEQGNTVAADKHGEKAFRFVEWDDLSESAKEGKRMQADFLFEKLSIDYLPDPLNPEMAWVQIDRNGLRQRVEIPFWLLAHLRAVSHAYHDVTGKQSEYMESYQEGFKGDCIVDWLVVWAEKDQIAPENNA